MCVYLLKQNRTLDGERMRLWNKLLIREAQAPIFSESQITGEAPVEKELPRPVQAVSRYWKGLTDARERLKKKPLPDDITMPIVKAVEDLKEAA